jgi:flagellar hook-basal body complex protein FliE
MTLPISQIGAASGIEQLKPMAPAGAPGDFQNVLDSTIQNLSSLNQDASGAVQKFMTGENEELHSMVLATQRAEIAFDLGLQVRNKVVQAYQEIMRMQM